MTPMCGLCTTRVAQYKCPDCGRFICSTCSSNGGCVQCRPVGGRNPNTAGAAIAPPPADSRAQPSPIAKAGLWSCLGCLSLLIIAAVIGTIGDNGSQRPPGSSAPANGTTGAKGAPGEDFTIVEWGWATAEYGNRVIRGTVRNNTNREYGYVQVEFNLYDSQDVQVGSTFANVNNIEPHSTWRFEAMVMEDNASKALPKGVTGF